MKVVTFEFRDTYDGVFETFDISFPDNATEDDYEYFGNEEFEIFLSRMISEYGDSDEAISEIRKNSFWCYDDENIEDTKEGEV